MSQAPLRPHFPEREATKIQKKITKGKLKWDNEPVRSQETLILEILSQNSVFSHHCQCIHKA